MDYSTITIDDYNKMELWEQMAYEKWRDEQRLKEREEYNRANQTAKCKRYRAKHPEKIKEILRRSRLKAKLKQKPNI